MPNYSAFLEVLVMRFSAPSVASTLERSERLQMGLAG
jgi:hypothetical protein